MNFGTWLRRINPRSAFTTIRPSRRVQSYQFSRMNSSAAWQLEHVPATGGGNTPYSLFTRPIIKSEQDDREYRLINLENGIEALLIHDKETDKAAASMNIGVGHLSDPVSMHVDASPISEFRLFCHL
jgi:hypothetical protein